MRSLVQYRSGWSQPFLSVLNFSTDLIRRVYLDATLTLKFCMKRNVFIDITAKSYHHTYSLFLPNNWVKRVASLEIRQQELVGVKEAIGVWFKRNCRWHIWNSPTPAIPASSTRPCHFQEWLIWRLHRIPAWSHPPSHHRRTALPGWWWQGPASPQATFLRHRRRQRNAHKRRGWQKKRGS